jgi:hypothetical protein
MLLEIKATLAQVGIFLAGLTLSLALGVFLGAHLDGASGLLIATLLAGTGLLGAATFSQVVHDHIVTADVDGPLPTAPEPTRAAPQRKK